MTERSQTFNDDESEDTLITPRFDADETRRAHPVVPLDAIYADGAQGHKPFRRASRRSWPLSLIVVVLLAVVAVGGIATKVLRRAQRMPPAPAASAPAPPSTQTDSAQTPTGATVSSDEGRESRAPRRAHDARVMRSERTDEIVLPTGDLRDEDSEDKDDGQRDHDRGKGKHDGDKKDSRKESKRAKKAPRLVDVLKGP